MIFAEDIGVQELYLTRKPSAKLVRKMFFSLRRKPSAKTVRKPSAKRYFFGKNILLTGNFKV